MQHRAPNASLIRNTMMWEIGQYVAETPKARANATRNHYLTIGSGAGERFTPWLRIADGSPLLAHAIVAGELDVSFMNPAALLTQATRGVGMFAEALPLRVIATYPSWDRYLHGIHPRTGITSLAQAKERRVPLRLSIREDATHSTRVLIDQILAIYGFTLDDLVSWGGSLQLNGGPGDPRRLAAIQAGEVDAVLDEGIPMWLDPALAAGMVPMTLEDHVFERLQALGWRRVRIPVGRFPHLREEHECLDYGGWPIYTRESLPDEVAYKVCAALHNRVDEIPWERPAFTGIGQLGQDTDATPLDVPLHPGAERWYREHGYIK